MDSLKKIALTVVLAGTVFVLSAVPAGAVTTSYWGLTQQHVGQSGGSYNYSNTWTTSSGANEVIIKGYQDGGSSSYPAKYDYAVVEDDLFGWGDHWVHQPVTGNYPQNGTWYSRTFSGIPNGMDAAIRIEVKTGYTTSAGGNAYQS
jgi:hypothetical protein